MGIWAITKNTPVWILYFLKISGAILIAILNKIFIDKNNNSYHFFNYFILLLLLLLKNKIANINIFEIHWHII